jgi:hypothetical protein
MRQSPCLDTRPAQGLLEASEGNIDSIVGGTKVRGRVTPEEGDEDGMEVA